MKQADIVKLIASECELTQKKAEEALKVVLKAIEDGLKSDREVRLVGIGKLYVKTTAERKGRNPQTGGDLIIPQKNRVKFDASKLLEEAING